ncbi:MAG: hypothetical protein JRC86_00820 [Deltaproteobacteria bacterium]|nr:hypothetical protein [Deltaproteobacteria bacterium]
MPDKKEVAPDYSAFETKSAVNEDDVLGQITVLVDKLLDYDKAIAKAELDLKRQKAQRDGLAEKDLPELMISVGQTTLTTRSGFPIKLEKALYTNISKDRKPIAIKWLDDNGHGGMVKRQVVIAFNKCDEEKVAAFKRMIDRNWPNNKTVLDVNAASAKALVKKLLGDGLFDTSAKEIFGVFEKDIVKISSKSK